MELELFNKELLDIAILDVFNSLIWNDKYCGCGDFEILLPVNAKIVKDLRQDYYLTMTESEHAMIIEQLEIHAETETGIKILVKGRSLESILYRRIIWKKISVTGNFQDAIHQLLDENAINPTDSDRKMSRLEFEESTDPIFDSLEVNTQFTEENYLYDVITALCLSAGVGYKITLTDSGNFRFKLYVGQDRSYEQLENPYVVFSPDFDNIINSDYINNQMPLKNVTLVAGEKGIGNERKTVTVSVGGEVYSDLDRREIFTDAQDVSRNVPDSEIPLTEEEYISLLEQRGSENLAKNSAIETFEGQADTSRTYIYGEDFSMGDIVQVANEYGGEARSRVVGLIHSQDASGPKVYPSFETVS